MKLNEIVLEGETAVVTGAGQGLGKAIARGLAEAGATVVLMDLREETALMAAEELRTQGWDCHAFHGDVTKGEDIDSLVRFTLDVAGHPTILINNAGISIPRRTVLEISREEWITVMNVNLNAVFFCSQTFAGLMMEKRKGKIVNMASMVGRAARPGIIAYATAKGAVMQLTRALAVDLAPYGINVNALAPGYIPTAVNEKVLSDPVFHREVLQRTPLGKLGTAEEIAAAVLYLCSPLASYVTGHILFIDGGWTSC